MLLYIYLFPKLSCPRPSAVVNWYFHTMPKVGSYDTPPYWSPRQFWRRLPWYCAWGPSGNITVLLPSAILCGKKRSGYVYFRRLRLGIAAPVSQDEWKKQLGSAYVIFHTLKIWNHWAQNQIWFSFLQSYLLPFSRLRILFPRVNLHQ